MQSYIDELPYYLRDRTYISRYRNSFNFTPAQWLRKDDSARYATCGRLKRTKQGLAVCVIYATKSFFSMKALLQGTREWKIPEQTRSRPKSYRINLISDERLNRCWMIFSSYPFNKVHIVIMTHKFNISLGTT